MCFGNVGWRGNGRKFQLNKAKMTYRCDPNDPNNTNDPNDPNDPKTPK